MGGALSVPWHSVCTALESAKVAAAGFVIPFLFVASPIFILRPEVTSLTWVITSIVGGLLMIVCLQASLVNCFLAELRRWERTSFFLGGLSLFLYLLMRESYVPFLSGILAFVVAAYAQMAHRRKFRRSPPGQNFI